ncbi:MAG: twin-arginine translocation signal domain-containing protein, partial [Burkholderiales bacterium]
MTSRRGFLRSLAVLGAAAASPLRAQAPRFGSYPFSLGVASGYPTADGVVLWTRLTGVDPVEVALRWEI